MTNQEIACAKMEQSMNQLIDKECWSIIAGAGTGSMVSIDFGQRIKRSAYLNKPGLSEEQRLYIGEFSLFLEHCAWRVDSRQEIVTGSTDSNTKGGSMLSGLKRIVGSRVESFKLSFPGMDLLIEFDNGITLQVFCDQVNLDDSFTNYNFMEPTAVYTVGAKSILSIEAR